MAGYDTLPNQSEKVQKFTVDIPDQDVAEFKQLIKLSKLGPKTYENLNSEGKYGLTYEWMENAKRVWESGYDWREREEYINSFPHFKADITDDDGERYDIHFVALFSKNKDAVPILFMHGWPGSFLEFLELLEVFRKKYTADDLPFHLVAPSLPGYTLSSGPSLKHDSTNADAARILHKLMMTLGFEGGYVAQGGDIGSYTSRVLAATYDECKAMHLNFCYIPKPANAGELSAEDQKAVEKGQTFAKFGAAYALEHGTRPSTIGFTLASSPVAVLAWIGEKFLHWTDKDPPLEQILDFVSLYWLTETFPRCIYPYRQAFRHGPERYFLHADEQYYCRKPFGFSYFPEEIYPIPKAWIETTGDLVYFKKHDRGGHFAAMEQPQVLAEDVEQFVKQVWKR